MPACPTAPRWATTSAGWLTAATAQSYRDWLDTQEWVPEIGLGRAGWDVHGVYVPESHFDLAAEAERIVQSPEFKAKVEQQGAYAAFMGPAELGAFTKRELDYWGPVLKGANIKVE